ncbi:MAG: C40 family peptidase [Thermomicrobiales bacterium]
MSRHTIRPRGPRAVIVAVAVLALAVSALWIPALAQDDPIVGTARVVNTDGHGLNLRDRPWIDADVLLAIPEGADVDVLATALLDDSGAEWWSIRVDGVVGYSAERYLALRGNAPPPAPPPGSASAAGQQAVVVATDGQGLNLRENPWVEADILVSMSDGTAAEVLKVGLLDDSGMEWWKVSVDGVEGYSVAAYLAATGAAPVSGPAQPRPAGFGVGQPVRVSGTGGEGVNVRDGAGVESAAVDRLPEDTIVTIADGPISAANGAAWYRVTAAGVNGWVHGGYLAAVPVAGPILVRAAAGGDSGSGVGDAIVAGAMAYVGVPYLPAGTTSSGFDASGFTYFVVNRVLGSDFPRAIDQQIRQGVAIDVASLRPGDLVFFEDTSRVGLSHVGIYVGDGQFISAGGSSGGVGLDNLNDDYWSGHYVTARRIGG